MTDKLVSKMIGLIEADGLGTEFPVLEPYSVAAECWPDYDGFCTRYYYEYYILYDGNIEFVTTDRSAFIKELKRII